MEASELYIGKYYTYKGEVIKLTLDHLYWLAELVYDIEDFNPIPLTEEILLKCGMVQCGYDLLFWKHEKLSFEFAGINWADEEFPEYQFLTIEFSDIKIEHLHQLQNFIFSLTGEELKIEL